MRMVLSNRLLVWCVGIEPTRWACESRSLIPSRIILHAMCRSNESGSCEMGTPCTRQQQRNGAGGAKTQGKPVAADSIPRLAGQCGSSATPPGRWLVACGRGAGQCGSSATPPGRWLLACGRGAGQCGSSATPLGRWLLACGRGAGQGGSSATPPGRWLVAYGRGAPPWTEAWRSGGGSLAIARSRGPRPRASRG